MQSGFRGTGFTEDIGELLVVWQNASHVNQSIIRGSLVGKEELVDLVIIHLGEMGKGCCIDKGNFQSNEQSQSQSQRVS